MARFVGDASWFCCYPDSCGCDACCCQGSNCSGGCSSSSQCGVGACCTCNSGNWGYAWKNNCTGCCNASLYGFLPCGATAWIGNPAGTVWNQAAHVDTGPSTCVMVDMTSSLFVQYAPLSQGIVSNVIFCTDAPAC